MSGAVNPIDNPQAWDFVTIASIDSPGVCEVGECKRKHDYDVKKGKGTSGATTTFTGKPPATFSIKFKLWTPAHFTAWDAFRPLLKYDPTKKAAQAFDIYHPALADVDVKSVITESIGSIVHEGGQLYSLTVEFMEYFPASKTSAVSTPSGSQSNGPTYVGGAPPGNNPDNQIANLQNQAGALAKQAQQAAA
jgi:hypothetical protein